MFELIRKIKAKVEEKKQERNNDYINSLFDICIQNGGVFVVVNGVAVFEATGDMTIDSLLKQIEQMKSASSKFNV